MAGLRLPFAVTRAYCSPLLRARQTAEALMLRDAMQDARLMEQHWGQWEGLTREQILAAHGEDAFVLAGSQRGTEFRPLAGESTGELHDRVGAFLKDAASGQGDAVAVAHLGVLRAAYTLATGWAMDTAMPTDLDVSKILVLSLDAAGTPKVDQLNVEFSAVHRHHPPLA